MIELRNLTKTFTVEGQRTVVVNRVNAVFPTGVSVGLLGRNGAGKSTLLKIIAGTMNPTSGRVISDGTVSWPVGFAGSFHPELTGAQNTRFIARVYGVDTDALVEFVEDFAELGVHFHQPFGTYSSGMRSRLAFGVSMGIRFDTYLVDEVTSVGDASFKEKSSSIFKRRMQESGAIVVSHSMAMMENLCDMGMVLENGNLVVHDTIQDAIKHHLRNMRA
ncbi:ABC transporter ATP-binding protein [Ponticoccus gilvus]|nr:ABC transporter ATP-binding protein [Enemella evansiae]